MQADRKARTRVALVELHVDLTGILGHRGADAVQRGILRDDGRVEKVQAALTAAVRLACELVVLPGWTLVSESPPPWILNASQGRTVVFECLLPSGVGRRGEKTAGKYAGDRERRSLPWETYAARDGKIVAGPIRQTGVSAADMRGAAIRGRFFDEVTTGARRVPTAEGDALLLVCGEANVVNGGGSGRACSLGDDVEASGLQRRIIVNPAHTPGGPQALRDKRAWLSRGGALVTTANTFSGLTGSKGARAAAKAWKRGRNAAASERFEVAPGAKITVVEV